MSHEKNAAQGIMDCVNVKWLLDDALGKVRGLEK